MDIVSKTISLEPYKTRYPVCFPAINDGEIEYLSDLPEGIERISNYGLIPLSVNEAITGNYSNFTQDMYDLYHGKVLTCYTLQQWLNEFQTYYNIISGSTCNVNFSNMVDYYNKTYPEGYNINTPQDIDRVISEHGGFAFYNWLRDNYFICYDFLGQYRRNPISGCTYSQWMEWSDNIGCSVMPYPAVVEFFGKMNEWHSLYSGDTVCGESDNCCDCVDYKYFGGDIMWLALSEWIENVTERIEYNDNKVKNYSNKTVLIPKIDIFMSVKAHMEDFGVLELMAKEFTPGSEYRNGMVTIYDNDVWILTGSTVYQSETFDDTLWERYYEYYKPQHSDEFIEPSEMEIISGRTDSSLDSFIRQEDTVDGMGNSLPGYFRPYSGSTVVQPAENTLLGFMYVPGTFANTNIEKDYGSSVGTADSDSNHYSGDYLHSITFFYRDWNGDVIDSTVFTSNIGDDPLDSIAQSINAATEAWDDTPNDGKIYADFLYYKGVYYRNVVNEDTDVVEPVVSGSCVACVDHCTVNELYTQYHISDTESYPVRYYEVIKDTEVRYPFGDDDGVNVNMCDFSFNPGEYETTMYDFVSPVFRKEELLGFSMKENPKGDIYIDRGYATVLDRHLRIGEVFDYEQLEKYGNGMFRIFPADEDIV